MSERQTELKTFRLDRTNNAPLEFLGRLLTKANSANDGNEDRWHEISVYSSAENVIAQVCYVTTWEQECSTSQVWVLSKPHDLISALLQDYVITENFVGHPAGAHDAERKNLRLRADLIRRYRACVDFVFRELGIVEKI